MVGGREATGQAGEEAHLFLQITRTCWDSCGCGATLGFKSCLVAASDCEGEGEGDNDNDDGAGGSEGSPWCSPSSPSSALFLPGISGSSR